MEFELSTDRSIAADGDDALRRGPFVDKLIRALITPVDATTAAGPRYRATGLTIGVTGPWGSGKSSVLNLLEKRLRDQCAHQGEAGIVLVRFDPWIVADSESLISDFFIELSSVVDEMSGGGGKLKDTWNRSRKDILDYAAALVRFVPGVGAGMAAAAEKAKQQIVSIARQRKKLRSSLQALDLPIVVFVDELDRVEDDEILTMARLVKSVADFDCVSYVLAYDHDRVSRALAKSASDKADGTAYLEKIVQLEIALPRLSDDDKKALLMTLLSKSPASSDLGKLRTDRRFEVVLQMVAFFSNSVRDLKRIANYFSMYRLMIESHHVDPVDLTAFSALSALYPDVVLKIRKRPHYLATTNDVALGEAGHDWFFPNRSHGEHRDHGAFELCRFIFPDSLPGKAYPAPPNLDSSLRKLETLNIVLGVKATGS
jgi:predicted KAP-like P-loop ATPase